MSLKKYDELTDIEKAKVHVMYSDLTTVTQYLYNFDKDKYLGRQYTPPSGKDEKVGIFGTIHAEPLISEELEEKAEPKKSEKKTTKKK